MAIKKKSKLDELVDSFRVQPKPIDHKKVLKSYVRGHYDIQETRMAMAQRLCTNILVKLGVDPGKKIDDSDPLIKKLMKMLLSEYNLITEAMIDQHHTLKKALQESDGVISDATEYALMRAYARLQLEETHLKKQLKGYLENFDLWNDFLKHIDGIGELMGGVIISEFDIHGAKYASSLWKYAGLDVVEVIDEKGTRMEGRGRKKSHLRVVDYIDKKGKPATKKGLTYNPFLKSKLMGVLAPGMIMQHARKDNHYGEVYYNYKQRITQRVNLKKLKLIKDGISEEDVDKIVGKEYPPKRIDLMARRYMIKMFLKDMYPVWKTLEGLEVHPSYEEAKLGITHPGIDIQAKAA